MIGQLENHKKVRKQLEKENREIKTEFEIKNMELRQLQDKAASYENENERFQRSLLEAHQKLADERVKSEAKEKGLIFKVRVLSTIDLGTIKCHSNSKIL